MALTDDIEFYGRAVEAGEMTRDDAVRLLVEASAGGLTESGASHLIVTWETARASYVDEARLTLQRLADLKRRL
ncbi:hypothetical protein ACIQV3_22680 [Streptomyces sp. NPDC099050]|uniref:hypothetical protein n=1 Tax=Streptomyces sp. NPDC099050 TaxID=3366100 RepID=UPI0038044D60